MSEHETRVLFVDDEPALLDGLMRVLALSDVSWTPHTALSGPEALRMLAEEHYQVIVSDLVMPGMSGAELLEEAAHQHPQMVRIALSGNMASARPRHAHRYIQKPCEPAVIRSVVDLALESYALIAGTPLAFFLSEPRPVVEKVLESAVINAWNAEVPLPPVGEHAHTQPSWPRGLTQLVTLAQSADTERARRLRGLSTDYASQLIAAAAVFDTCCRLPLAERTALWEHSLGVAQITLRIAERELLNSELTDAFLAGLLHDLGRLLLGSDDASASTEGMRPQDSDTASTRSGAERAVSGPSHAHAGAALLGLWGWPNSIVDAVRRHDRPAGCSRGTLDLATIVHVANAFAHEREGRHPNLDEAHLSAIGVSDRLRTWRTVSDLRNGVTA